MMAMIPGQAKAMARRIFLRPLVSFRRIRKDEKGATIVEFALIAMPFFAIICAIFEIAYVNFENEMLADAVSKASRSMLTGKIQLAHVSTASQFVSTYLCPTTGGRVLPANFNCSNLIVDVRPATSFVSGDVSNDFYKSASNEFCPGAPGQIVVLRVAYPLGSIFPLSLFSRNVGVVNDVPGLAGNYHMLMGAALFQEETYSGAFTAPAGC